MLFSLFSHLFSVDTSTLNYYYYYYFCISQCIRNPTTAIDYSKVFDMQAIDFLDKLLRYDHQDRLTAKEAMVIQHF